MVQERVVPSTEEFVDADGPTASHDLALNWGALCVRDSYVGCLVRGLPPSRGPVINQGAGAGQTGVLRPG